MAANGETPGPDYPVLQDFLNTALWSNSDGANVITLLVRFTWFAHPARAGRLIDESKRVAQDTEYPPERLSKLFNRESCHPYVVVTPDNATDFCESMAETLQFVVERQGAQGRR